MLSVGEYLFWNSKPLTPCFVPANPEPAEPVPMPQFPRRIYIRDITQAVSKVSGVSVDAIESERKFSEITRARWAMMLLASELTNVYLSDIGRCLGGKNHATVIHGIERAKELIAAGDADLCGIVSQARERVCAR
jgi:chromosomal replication initiator protein